MDLKGVALMGTTCHPAQGQTPAGDKDGDKGGLGLTFPSKPSQSSQGHWEHLADREKVGRLIGGVHSKAQRVRDV